MDTKDILKEMHLHHVVSIVPADSLTPVGAKTSAGTKMIKFKPWGIWLQSQISKFQTHFNNKYIKYFLRNCYQQPNISIFQVNT